MYCNLIYRDVHHILQIVLANHLIQLSILLKKALQLHSITVFRVDLIVQ
jgi:hypothetical protein